MYFHVWGACFRETCYLNFLLMDKGGVLFFNEHLISFLGDEQW